MIYAQIEWQIRVAALSILKISQIEKCDTKALISMCAVIENYLNGCIFYLKLITCHSKRLIPNAFDLKQLIIIKSIDVLKISGSLQDKNNLSRKKKIRTNHRSIVVPKGSPAVPLPHTYKQTPVFRILSYRPVA